MKPEWSIRAYREGDEEGIYELWRAVLPSEKRDRAEWLRWWHWMYQENPAGKGLIWLAEANGRIAAQHALVPVRLKVGSQTVLGSWGMDAMTHPDYRRQGLFEAISKELGEHAARIGMDIETGIPNQYSHPGLVKKLDWFDIAPTKVTLKTLNWKPVITSKIKNRLLSGFCTASAILLCDKVFFRTRRGPAPDGLNVTQINSFDERFDRLWSRVGGQYPIMTVRDKDYLNWRFSPPGTHYLIFAAEKANEIRGYLVIREKLLGDTRASVIFDLIAESPEVIRRLVAEAAKVCQHAGVDLMVYSFIADGKLHQAVKNSGFISLPFLKGDYFCAYSKAAGISKAFLQDPRNWLVQLADTDTI